MELSDGILFRLAAAYKAHPVGLRLRIAPSIHKKTANSNKITVVANHQNRVITSLGMWEWPSFDLSLEDVS